MFINPNFPPNAPVDKTTPPPDAKKRKINIDQYNDPISGLSGRWLRYGLWLAKHRMVLRRTAITILIMVSAVTWIYSISWLVYALAYGNTQSQQVDRALTAQNNYVAINKRFAAKPLQINSTAIFPSGSNKSDAVAMVFNPNANFSALFEYYFVIGGTNTPAASAILLPAQTSPVAYLGHDGSMAGASLVIKNVNWRRVDAHQIKDVKNWMANRQNLTVENLQVLSPGVAGGVGSTIIKFDLVNNSTYGYKYPRFYVGLYQSGALSGLIVLELDKLEAQSTRAVDVRSFSSMPINEVKVFPLFDLFDPTIYLPPPS